MKTYTVIISGVEHTMQADSEDALRARGYEVKSAAKPANKAAVAPRNKEAGSDDSELSRTARK